MSRWRSLRSRLAAALGLGVLGVAAAASGQLAGDGALAAKARDLTLELSTSEADAALATADRQDPLLTIERARVLLYEGRCADAAALLARPELAEAPEAAQVGGAARGCEKSMAGASIVEDEPSGAWLRFQDEADQALAPLLVEVVRKSREVFERELGVTMPRPVRVELVRDQRALSAMTGLPLAAARTTGTIGIAKWGRVIVVSPRAAPKGYAFLDTLAHELTHLALTRGSRDRAPLWLQEGVARRLETGWRDALPFDHQPSADDLAGFGIAKGLGPDIDKIGPSIALLPSAEEAHVTYAKVESFMGFYAREAGDGSMNKLLSAFKEVNDPDEVDRVVERVTGTPFSTWSDRWKAEIGRVAKELPAEQQPGAPPDPALRDVRKRVRLGQLLLDRDHAEAAGVELGKGHAKMPREAFVRALLAAAERRRGDDRSARTRVESTGDVSGSDARWWSMRGALVLEDAARSFGAAVAQAPYDPAVACEELPPPALPSDPIRKVLCEAARLKPRAR